VGLTGRDAQSVTTKLMEEGQGCMENQKLLHSYRSSAFNVRFQRLTEGKEETSFKDIHKLVTADPIGFLAWTQISKLPDSLSYIDEPWYSDFQHKTMILIGVLSFFHLQPGPTELASIEPLAWTIEQVKKLAIEVVQPFDPNEATEILDIYLPALLDVGGTSTGTIEELTEREEKLKRGETAE